MILTWIGLEWQQKSCPGYIRVDSCNFRAKDHSAVETYDGPTQNATSKTLEWSFKGLLRHWNLRWAHLKSHLQDYGMILFFERFRAVTFEQIRADSSERITPHVRPTMGPAMSPPGPWSDHSKVHSVIETYDGHTLKATSRTMGWSFCFERFRAVIG